MSSWLQHSYIETIVSLVTAESPVTVGAIRLNISNSQNQKPQNARLPGLSLFEKENYGASNPTYPLRPSVSSHT